MKEISQTNFKQEVLQSDIPVLVDFWAPWCVPCKKLLPALTEIASQFKNKVKFVKVNIEEAAQLATTYMVMSIPALILFKDGAPCEKKTGLMSKDALVQFISAYA